MAGVGRCVRQESGVVLPEARLAGWVRPVGGADGSGGFTGKGQR